MPRPVKTKTPFILPLEKKSKKMNPSAKYYLGLPMCRKV